MKKRMRGIAARMVVFAVVVVTPQILSAQKADSLRLSCDGGDAIACYNLGVLYNAGEGVARNDLRAASLYESACDGGLAAGCYNLAVLYTSGQGVEQDAHRAASLYQEACNGGYAMGCYNLGVLYDAGEGVVQDDLRAASLYESACDGGLAAGCYNLGFLYDLGRGVMRDDARAASLYERACSGGVADGCYNLGVLYRAGEGVVQDDLRAASLYKQACDEGSAAGCNNLAFLYGTGEGVARDVGYAASLYAKACDGGDMEVCYNLGVLYASGEEIQRDIPLAASLYEQACDQEYAAACYDLGIIYDSGDRTPQNTVRRGRAATLYARACDGRVAAGCNDLGSLYQFGEGVPHDAARAASLYEKACSMGAMMGCYNLGFLYATGDGVTQDVRRAATLYERACDGGYATACHNLGVLYDSGDNVEQSDIRAASFFERACDGEYAAACNNLGLVYMSRDGIAEDTGRAVALFEEACDLGYPAGCNNLGRLYGIGEGIARNDRRAASLYSQACNGGYVMGCYNLGQLYVEGQGVTRDDVRAAVLYEQACDGGYAAGCNNLGVLYNSGDGIPHDAVRAHSLFERACSGGYTPACESWLTAPISVRRAQSRADSAVRLTFLAVRHLAEASIAGNQRAEPLLQEAISLARLAASDSAEALALALLGSVRLNLGDSAYGVSYLEAALAIDRRIGDETYRVSRLHTLGSTYLALGEHDTGLARLREAITQTQASNDLFTEAAILREMSLGFGLSDQIDSAWVYVTRSLRASRLSGNATADRLVRPVLANLAAFALYGDRTTGDSTSTSIVQAFVAMTIATVDMELSRFDSVTYYLHEALSFVDDTDYLEGRRIVLQKISDAYTSLGRVDSAVAILRSLQPTAATLLDSANLTTAIGQAFNTGGQPDSALGYHRLALRQYEQARNEFGRHVAFHSIGSAFYELHEADSAVIYFTQAYKLAKDSVGLSPSVIHGMGIAYRLSNQGDSALSYFEAVLDSARRRNDRVSETYALSNLALTYQQAYSPAKVRTALAYWDSAAVLATGILQDAGADQNRVAMAERVAEMYETWPLAALALGNEMPWQEAALAAMAVVERGHAQAMLELMRRGRTPVAQGDDLVAEGRALIKSLKQGERALSYLLTQDTLVVWLLSPDRVEAVHRFPIGRDSVSSLVGGLRRGLGADGARSVIERGRNARSPIDRPAGEHETTSAASDVAEALGRLLLFDELREVTENATELVIIPRGALASLPFGVLPLPDGTLLAERFAIRYAPSLHVLQEAERRPSARGTTPDALVVGNPHMPEVMITPGLRIRLANLEGALRESEWVASKIGVEGLSGDDASEHAVRIRLPNVWLLHLATHGYAYGDFERSRNSFIALAPDDNHDGTLTVGEILDDPNIRLSAELVVLSACQSGLGNIAHAEGTLSFQRAFLTKGARSVLVSLWSVSDSATTALMEAFYSHWLDDIDQPTKAEALKRAQLDVRAIPGFEHPLYWAAFQIVGAN